MSEKWPEDGYLKTNGGEPFKTANAAKAAAASKGVGEDEYDVVEFGDGFACKRREKSGGDDQAASAAPARTASASGAKRGGTGFKHVTFNPRQNTNEPDDVVLGVNGHSLVIKRGVRTILPDAYLEAADHSEIKSFRQVGRDMRKEVVMISQYPYTVHGDATRDEYMNSLRAGTLATKKKLERDGEIPGTGMEGEG